VGVNTDVTEAREAERKLQTINELLEQRVGAALAEKAEAEAALMHAQRLESIGRLTGGVAHDFNNLLTVVIGALDIILRDPDNAARRTRLGEAALTAARRGERLTTQLLAFARRQPLQPESWDLNKLIQECEPLLKRAAGENVSLTLRLCTDAAVALIDRTQFEASLLNLVVNAVDASEKGGEVGIETRIVPTRSVGHVDTGEKQISIRVWDRGQGMSPDIQERIFDPFFTTKAPGKGTGLGLSQVYGFVKQSGGEIQVRSAPGEGTCLSVSLPLRSAVSQVLPSRPTTTIHGTPSLRILLAEDDQSVASITQAMLGELGHEVICTSNAEQAMRVLESATPLDVLLTDVIMPGAMTGVDLAREAVKLRSKLRVLLSTGYAGESQDEAIARGAWPVLRKPYLQLELADALEKLVSETQAEQSRSAAMEQ
jgi:signal transduction histidine kinase/CheY-like chemotaxis protein